MANKKIAIMQPYLFPYVGYFQLINAVDILYFMMIYNGLKEAGLIVIQFGVKWGIKSFSTCFKT